MLLRLEKIEQHRAIQAVPLNDSRTDRSGGEPDLPGSGTKRRHVEITPAARAAPDHLELAQAGDSDGGLGAGEGRPP